MRIHERTVYSPLVHSFLIAQVSAEDILKKALSESFKTFFRLLNYITFATFLAKLSRNWAETRNSKEKEKTIVANVTGNALIDPRTPVGCCST